MPKAVALMNVKTTKIRVRILKAFSAVLFFSFLLTGIIFNIAIRLFAVDGQNMYAETSRIVGRVGLIAIILMGVMFVVAVVVTYFLSNSITRPIEKLGKFALDIGRGDFTPNDLQFRERELEDLNLALNRSARQLGIYDSEQKAFFQNASHELRTPLMSIQCYAEGISFGLMEPKAASETILEETDKLSDLVTDLLYISKIDNITTAFTAAETDLVALVRESATRQETVAAKRQLRVSFDLDETPIPYVCISELVTRALDNLISNAVRYAATEITVSCHKKTDRVEIRVADDGLGIATELMPHIFERFFKGPDGNHGIGLSIVKTIVEQRGGRITVENKSPSGAVFTITLPI